MSYVNDVINTNNYTVYIFVFVPIFYDLHEERRLYYS